MAEAEVLGELASALSSNPSDALSLASFDGESPTEKEPSYLTVRQVAARIPYAEQTIRNMMSSGELRLGEHYFKRRGRVMFSWPAMRSWVEQHTTEEPQAIEEGPTLPLVRNGRYGTE